MSVASGSDLAERDIRCGIRRLMCFENYKWIKKKLNKMKERKIEKKGKPL